MIERAAAACHAGLDSLFVGDQHVSPTPYYQNTPMLGRLLAEWGKAPAGACSCSPCGIRRVEARYATAADGVRRVQTGLGTDQTGSNSRSLLGIRSSGKREARHGLEAPGPSFEMRPVGDFEPALGHEYHAAPAADIGNRAILTDEERLVFNRFVDKGQRRLRTRAKFGYCLRMGGTEPCQVAHFGDIGDVVGLP
jgi:hypothetical protein